MPYIIIGIVAILVIIIVIYTMIIKPSKVKKEISEKITNHFSSLGYSVTSKSKVSDLEITKDGKSIYFKYVIVPYNSQITINCKEIWKLSWGGNPSKVGRAYPNNRYLGEVKEFALAKLDGLKVFIIYPSTEHILRYINECELETVNVNKTPYGYKLINYTELEENISVISQ